MSYHVQFVFTFKNSKDISAMRNWKKICKKKFQAQYQTQHDIKTNIIPILSKVTRDHKNCDIINTPKINS